MNRVLFLIDGFSLYHSLDKKRQYHKYKWLDYSALARCFVTRTDQIVGVLYFTAYAYWNPSKVTRHKRLVQALRSKDVEVVTGKFYAKDTVIRISRQLSLTHYYHEEKRTDVNIAVRLFEAAMKDEYDLALIITADSDLVPAIEAVKRNFPAKRVRVVFPMDGYSKDLEDACGSASRIKEKHLKTCQLPDTVVVDSVKGIAVERPNSWR